jgi:hypothetical protein
MAAAAVIVIVVVCSIEFSLSSPFYCCARCNYWKNPLFITNNKLTIPWLVFPVSSTQYAHACALCRELQVGSLEKFKKGSSLLDKEECVHGNAMHECY